MIPQKIFEETLLEFLAPVRHFLADPSVSEVMINGPNQVFIERSGKLLSLIHISEPTRPY